MIKNIDIALDPEEYGNKNFVKEIISKKLQCSLEDITYLQEVKRSIDARGKYPVYRLNYNVFINEKFQDEDYKIDYKNVEKSSHSVTIIGFGPAGIFAALKALELGIKPIIFERGKDVRSRRKDLRNVMQFNIVNEDSNYCFGEGGAGTYSDGKLYTRSNKRGDVKKILEIFIQHGADRDIRVNTRPHIGTDKLPQIIQSMRELILAKGGEIHFNERVVDFVTHNNKIIKIITTKGDYSTKAVILATGHSARDIYYLMNKIGAKIEPKNYAIGVRIEHPQELIDKIQYHCDTRSEYLPPAYYNYVLQTKEKAVFSFCMCPGGIIVPASTSQEELVLNGMSPSRRNYKYANAGFVTEINEKDWKEFEKHGPFAALEYQKMIEKTMWEVTKSQKAPAIRIVDFYNKKLSSKLNQTSYVPGIVSGPLYELFPKAVVTALREGLLQLKHKMPMYFTNEGTMIAPESRTSSPIRIVRDKNKYCSNIENLFPAGEGAGYAGGIVSAAIDGENCMLAVSKHLLE
ncbi:MAG TPA: NAD(P)/FAD-dependent oxidoreductase [Ignavibacteriales bacterium]|nr:NAD(P)/FAD-dependent oxidoreductase [Ignavibacteriales bacterium]HOL81593.1 NAD(P)/FAD-dependent oxidoreductase [Ignavibacteriales bacterium]HOM65577.1 NAD(P)/FAD-dependent oxidoreductase [Ignavibacteriales bacterium]HPD67860.1 NAD(P)/FAD-dependent oxidoreductase [Ignavibacteriales bacterium]HPP33707.1 NAD(P)/FAD-dependent oxidoreductase [Ignavibacteriales bacterium]